MAQEENVNVSPEAVFAEMQTQVAQQSLDLAAERAARKEVQRQLGEARTTIDALAARLPAEVAKEVLNNGKEEAAVKPNRSQRRAKGDAGQAKKLPKSRG